MGYALPGAPLTTEALLRRIRENFAVDVGRPGRTVALKLAVNSRHICRDLLQRHERARVGDSNADLAARAVQAALREAAIGVAEITANMPRIHR